MPELLGDRRARAAAAALQRLVDVEGVAAGAAEELQRLVRCEAIQKERRRALDELTRRHKDVASAVAAARQMRLEELT